MSKTRDVIDYAKRHGGVITTREALDVGISGSTLDRRVADGVFVRIGRGILALPGTSSRPDALMRAAGRMLGAVISHHSAGRIHGFQPIPEAPPTVTVPYRGTHSFPGLVVHQSTDLLPQHVMGVRALRVTNPQRTVLDLAQVLGDSRLESVIDNALAGGMVDLADLVDLYLALTRSGKKGMRHLGRILSARAGEEKVSETVIETRLYRLLRDAGLPIPTKQFRAPWLEPINGRVDFAYLDEEIILEADSRRWHLISEAFDTDRRRDIAAQLAGWIVLRFTWKMITDEPDFVVNSVRNALSMRSGADSRDS